MQEIELWIAKPHLATEQSFEFTYTKWETMEHALKNSAQFFGPASWSLYHFRFPERDAYTAIPRCVDSIYTPKQWLVGKTKVTVTQETTLLFGNEAASFRGDESLLLEDVVE